MTGIVWWDGDEMSTMSAERASANLLVLFEDNHLLCVYKPAGLLSQGPGKTWNTVLDVCRAWLRMRYKKQGNIFVGLVHRLDRPVGGVMVITKTSKAASRLSRQFRSGEVTKIYKAVVSGTPRPVTGELRDYIRKIPGKRKSVITGNSHEGKAAVLRYETAESRGDFSLLTVRPVTGRSHQIRLQLSAAGCPIVGDWKYGSAHSIERGIGLRAAEIRFSHPTKHQPMVIHAPTPPDWPWPPTDIRQAPRKRKQRRAAH